MKPWTGSALHTPSESICRQTWGTERWQKWAESCEQRLSGESPCMAGNRNLCRKWIVSGMLGSIICLAPSCKQLSASRVKPKSQVKTVMEVSVRFMRTQVSTQIILFHFVTNRLLTFPTLVRFVLPMLLLSASKGFSAFFLPKLFILPSAFLTGSLTLMYLCGLSVFRFRLQPMARHLILCIYILPTGSNEDYKGWIFSFAVQGSKSRHWWFCYERIRQRGWGKCSSWCWFTYQSKINVFHNILPCSVRKKVWFHFLDLVAPLLSLKLWRR